MSLDYYDRQGQPMDATLAWAKKLEESDYKRVAETVLANGRWVSTVWLGLNHQFSETGPPLIFETMVFPSANEFSELECARYATEAEAIEGHAALCKQWESKP